MSMFTSKLEERAGREGEDLTDSNQQNKASSTENSNSLPQCAINKLLEASSGRKKEEEKKVTAHQHAWPTLSETD